jgi:DNA polymerase-3 subunit alpha
MFDLWGKEVPVPMPGLDLESSDIPVREKLAWEKELLGVYLSEHPFSSMASKGTKLNLDITLCGQIDVELAGQAVAVAGIVASVRYLFTRDGRPFASAVLEDLEGSIGVMVWPKVYAETKDLWQEGNILLVEGKVKLSDDEVQLNCDSVRDYQAGVAPDGESITSEPQVAPTIAEEPAPPAISRRLMISLTQSQDKDGDVTLLRELVDILKDFPGKDEVSLKVTNGSKVTHLKLVSLTVSYGAQLHERLAGLVGEEGLRVEP